MAPKNQNIESDVTAPVGAQQSNRWSLERSVAIVNLLLLIAGTGIVLWDAKYHHITASIDAVLAEEKSQNTEMNIELIDTGAVNGGLHLYDVKYHIKSMNISKREANYTYSVLVIYRGSLLPPSAVRDGHALLNAPPPLWTAITREAGAITWGPVTCVAAIQVGGPRIENLASVKEFLTSNCPKAIASNPIETGGGLTGEFPPGIPTSYSPEFLIWASPKDFLGTSLGYGLDGDVNIANEDVTLQQDLQPFGAATLAPPSSGTLPSAASPPRRRPG